MNRCTGHCCAVFTLDTSPEKVATKNWARGAVDGEEIQDMVIPLKEYEPYVNELGNTRYFYTCRHFDGENCNNYENRPSMCRSYPDGGNCVQLGCTLKCDPNLEDTWTSKDHIARQEYKKRGIKFKE